MELAKIPLAAELFWEKRNKCFLRNSGKKKEMGKEKVVHGGSVVCGRTHDRPEKKVCVLMI